MYTCWLYVLGVYNIMYMCIEIIIKIIYSHSIYLKKIISPNRDRVTTIK